MITDRDRMELVREKLRHHINQLIDTYEDLSAELDGVPRLLPYDRNWPMARRIENVRAITSWRERTESGDLVMLASGTWVEREKRSS
jgi:hypothetical protein